MENEGIGVICVSFEFNYDFIYMQTNPLYVFMCANFK